MTFVRERTADGERMFAIAAQLGSRLAFETFSKSGSTGLAIRFDWTRIDHEHGVGDDRESIHQLPVEPGLVFPPSVRA